MGYMQKSWRSPDLHANEEDFAHIGSPGISGTGMFFHTFRFPVRIERHNIKNYSLHSLKQ